MIPWFRVQSSGDIAQVFVGDNIGCWGQPASDLLEEIGSAGDVRLIVDSTGGNMDTALQLYDALIGRVSEAHVVGSCLSSAIPILLGARRRTAAPSARLMVHSPTNACLGSAADLRQCAESLDRLTARVRDIICTRLEADPDTVHGWLSGPDVWFDPGEALAVRLVDEILDPPALPEGMAAASLDTAWAEPLDDGAERLLLEMLPAVGRVATRDRKRLLREMSAWVNQNVRQVER